MKIKLSKAQWEKIGKECGWISHIAQQPLEVINVGKKDDWDRPIYRDRNGKTYVDIELGKVDPPALHTVSPSGEPDSPLHNFRVISDNKPAAQISIRKPDSEEDSIARTILQQLGGTKFMAMTGAVNLLDTGNGLSFRLVGSHDFIKNGINYVKITLDPSDTYTMEFGKIRGSKYTVIKTLDNIYNDNLREIFTRETGLETSL
jgi:hypothetical protein